MEKTVESVPSQSGRIGGMPCEHSTAWDIGLEDDLLPSDPSSFACDTTVVIDTGRIWDHQEETRQSLQTDMNYCGKSRPLPIRSLDEYSRPTARVESRFFLKRVPGFSLREDRPSPHASRLDWEDLPDREPEVPTLDDCLDHSCPAVGWDGSSNQGTESFFGDYCGTPLAGACIRGH